MILPVSFQSKRILVTGAGRGLGKEIVRCLVKNNATVFALSKTQSKLDELKKEFPQVNILQADLQNWDKTREIVKSIGTIHGLVNNAAINIAGPFLKITKEDVDMTMNSNLKPVINVSQVVCEDMIKRGEGGSIVTISSIASKMPVVKQHLYGASKAAITILCQGMSMEMGKHNIRVNTVNPGLFESDMSKVSVENKKGFFYTNNMNRQHIKRLITTTEIANTAMFLLSDCSGGITGQAIFVCGGITAS